MSALLVMVLLPIAVLCVGLVVYLMAYVGSVRTPYEQSGPGPNQRVRTRPPLTD